MQLNTLAKQHIEFCKSKGLPIGKFDLAFVISRIEIEVQETIEAFSQSDERVQEELVDVLLQTIQALAIIDPDIESAIKRKIEINKKRVWKKK